MKTPAPRLIPVTVSLPPAIVAEIDQVAEKQDRSRSFVTAAAIAEFLERRRAEAGPPEGDTPC